MKRPLAIECKRCDERVSCSAPKRKALVKRFCSCNAIGVWAYTDAVGVSDGMNPFVPKIIWSKS